MKKQRILFSLVLSVFILPVMCFAQQENSDNPLFAAREFYEKGKQCIEAGDWRQADEYLRKAEDILVKDTGIYSLGIPNGDILDKTSAVARQALPQAETKKPLTKRELKKKALREKEESEKKLLAEAQAACLSKDWAKADNIFLKASQIWPKDPAIWFNLGVINIRLQDYSKAAYMFKKCVSLNKKDSEAYYNLAVLYESFLNNERKAVDYYEKYLKLSSGGNERERIRSWINYIQLQKK